MARQEANPVLPVHYLQALALLCGQADLKDADMVADMLVPLRDGDAVLHFTCRHWDPASRLCTVYDRRPRMCRDYPHARMCDHGCGFYTAECAEDVGGHA